VRLSGPRKRANPSMKRGG